MANLMERFIPGEDNWDSYEERLEQFFIVNDFSSDQLRLIFATFGLPEIIVTDNGSPFTSTEFLYFCKMNGIEHIRSPPYHPATNGAAENLVKEFKSKVKTLLHSNVPLQIALPRFLFNSRITPHTATGEAPSKILLGRIPRSRLALVKPNLDKKKMLREENGSRVRSFSVGDRVMARQYQGKERWAKGKVLDVKGTRNFVIRTDSGLIWHRHLNQIRKLEEQRDNEGLGKAVRPVRNSGCKIYGGVIMKTPREMECPPKVSSESDQQIIENENSANYNSTECTLVTSNSGENQGVSDTMRRYLKRDRKKREVLDL